MPFQRKYGTLLVTGTTSIRIPIIKRAAVDFALGADWTPAAGDVKVFVDAAAVANITNLPTAIASGNGAFWEFILTAAELTCKQLLVVVSDAATKSVEDQSFIVETYGNASAMYVTDFSAQLATPTNITAATGVVLSGVTHTGAVIPTVSAVTGLTAANLDTTISSRMATYTQPTGFLAATFPTGTVANTTNITAGTITTTTNLTTNNDKTGYSLTATTGLGNQTANITGNLSGSVGSVTGAVGSVTGAVGSVTGAVGSVTGNVTGSVGSLAAQAKADVNAEVVDALATDTYAEPAQGAPAATTTLAVKINYIYKFLRNKITTTSSQISIYDDAGTTVDQKSTISDDATTFTRGEFGTGP